MRVLARPEVIDQLQFAGVDPVHAGNHRQVLETIRLQKQQQRHEAVSRHLRDQPALLRDGDAAFPQSGNDPAFLGFFSHGSTR